MNCPNCNTPNEPTSTFCVKCGESLGGKVVARKTALANSVKELLGVLTLRALVVLIILWLVYIILNWLPFVREMRISGINISLKIVIASVIYLIVVIVLNGYAKVLRVLWPKSFPQTPEFGSILATLVYLGILAAIYYAFGPLLRVITTDSSVITIFQAILFVISIVLIIPAITLLFRVAPYWLATVRDYRLGDTRNHVACLACGHINHTDHQHCSHCGARLTQTS